MFCLFKSIVLALFLSCIEATNFTRDNNFILLYESDTISQKDLTSKIKKDNVGFSNGMLDNNNFDKYYNIEHTNCLLQCKNNMKCLGVFEYEEDNKTICNLLPSINSPIFHNMTSYSWLKVREKTYEDKTYSIEGSIYDSYDTIKERHYSNTTVFLDFNHNGILDSNEPYQITDYEFEFNNLNPGTYLIKQIVPEKCYQLYPGVYGNYRDYNYHGNGYIDNVVYYYAFGHHTKGRPHGGKIDSNIIKTNIDYSYILGNNPEYYFSFYPENIIVFSFIDETIIDTPGDDIFIDIYGSSTTKANIYVSHNNIDYYFLGILDNNHTSFDLSNSKEDYPINYIKLMFYVDNFNHNTMYNSIDIISIYGEITSLYEPAYSYYIILTETTKTDYVVFFNDCHNMAGSYFYCVFNMFTDNEIESCLYGSKLFDKTQNCYCDLENSNIIFNGTIFDYDACNVGCHHSMRQYVSLNYTMVTDANGFISNEIQLHENCSYHCLGNMLRDCNLIDSCSSFSLYNNLLDDEYHGHIYNQPYYKTNTHYNLFIKNKYLQLSQQSTTSTTSQTSSTTSQTSSTSSQTSSTTSQTSSTTSHTSSTSSQTSSTTSQTSSTSSQTSSTTSQTSSITSQTTIIVNANNKINKKLYYIIPLSIITLIILVSLIIFLLLTYRFRNTRVDNTRVDNTRVDNPVSFSNPVYSNNQNNIETEEINYQEIDNNYSFKNRYSYDDRDYMVIE